MGLLLTTEDLARCEAASRTLGQHVLTVPAGIITAGTAPTITIGASPLPSGTYLYRIVMRRENNVQTTTGRMVLVR